MQNPDATSEMKVKFQQAIDKLEAEIKSKKQQAEHLRGGGKGAWGKITDADQKRSEEIDKLEHKKNELKKKIERTDKVSDKTKKLVAAKKQQKEKLQAAKPEKQKTKAAVKKTVEKEKEQRSKEQIKADYQAAVEKVEKQPKFADLTEAEVIAAGLAINAQRNFYSQIMDNSSDNKRRLSPTPENLLRWMKEPGKFDLIGVDTFKRENPTADYKRVISKQKIFNLMGIKV